MPRLTLLILTLAAAAGATAGLPGILASGSLDANVDNSRWQAAGNVFHYQATLPDLTSIVMFDAIIHEATSSVVRVDVVILDGMEAVALQGSYDRLTREDLRKPGVYAPLWVTQADVARGHAKFGDRTLTYVPLAGTVHRVFQDGESRYSFDRTEGYLVGIENVRSGAKVTLVGKATGAAVPLSPQTTDSEPITVRRNVEVRSPGGMTEAAQPPDATSTMLDGGGSPPTYQYPITTLNLECVVPVRLDPQQWALHSFDGYATEKCVADYYVEATEDFSYGEHALQFPRYAIGRVEAWYRDEETGWMNGIARHHYCAPDRLISTDEDSVTCTVTYPRGGTDLHMPGRNWVETQGVWNFCLDPTTGWSCKHTWPVTARGHITCYEVTERCR